MKKAIVLGLAAVCAVGAKAQNDMVVVKSGDDKSQTKVTAEAALVSSYVWRGQVYNNDFVFQPQMTVEKYGVSFNVWGNYNIAGSDIYGNSSDLSEIDLTLAYTLPFNLEDATFDVGYTSYSYPNERANGDTISEVYGVATLLTWKDYLIPSVSIYGGLHHAEGIYMLFDVVAPYQVSDYFRVEGGASAGWGSTAYNDMWFNDDGEGQDAKFNDFNVYANASYDIMENLSVAVNLTYTWLYGGAIHNAAGNLYDDDSKLWGGVNLIYDF